MLRFLSYLLVFILGGGLGFFFGGFGGVGLGLVAGSCKTINAGVAQNALTQDEADGLVRTVAEEIAKETGQSVEEFKKGLPRLLEQMKKNSPTETPCQLALAKLQS